MFTLGFLSGSPLANCHFHKSDQAILDKVLHTAKPSFKQRHGANKPNTNWAVDFKDRSLLSLVSGN